MLWWTGCIGCGPTCGGRRRRSEPERAGGEQAGALGLACFDGGGSLERRRCGRCLGRWVAAPLVVCSRPLSVRWRFLRLRQHTGARYGSRPRQRRATPPRLAGRSRQTAALAAAAFEAASPSLSIWGGVGVPVPQLAALCVGARTRADTE